jgi:terminase large subunit-like protein
MQRQKIHLNDLLHFSPKQEEARKQALTHRYTLYGGAMAGGKSYWLRWMLVALLIRWASRGHRSVEVGLFCEDYPTLKDRQLSKIGSEFPSWLGQLHGDHAQHGRCYILADEYGGGIIKFRNLDDPSKYQSAEFAAIAVDELTKNTEDVFTDLRNRLRWPGITDIRFLAATNPGGIGHSWVKKLWLDRIFDDNEVERDQFVYVRALAQDNPHIDKSYLKQLESLPPDKRKAYLEGDWDIFKGQYFTEWRREIHVCQPFQIPDDWRKFAALDYGHAAPSSLGWYAVAPEGRLYRYRELYQTGLNYSQLGEQFVAMTPPGEHVEYIVADPAIWKHEPGNPGSLTGAEIIQNRINELMRDAVRDPDRLRALKAPPLLKADNNRVVGWQALREYLRPYLKEEEATAKLQVFSTCTEFIRTVPALIHDEHNPEDVDSDGEDHAGDEVRYAVMSRPKPSQTADQRADHYFNKRMKEKKQKRERTRLFIQ